MARHGGAIPDGKKGALTMIGQNDQPPPRRRPVAGPQQQPCI
jgi:hypothetical protein